MHYIFDFLKGDLSLDSWASQISFLILLALVVTLILSYFLHHIKKLSDKTSNLWDDAVIKAVKLPSLILLWLVTAKIIIDVLSAEFRGENFSVLNHFVKTSVIISISWFLFRLINNITQAKIESNISSGDEFDRTTIDAFAKLSKLTVIVIMVLVTVHGLGVNLSGILAAGGAGGLVLGFAAKDLFANFFGGLTIYLDRPFSVGDWIRCNEKSIEGVVEHIGWRHTRLRALNANPIYVPNAIFTTIVVENPSRMTHRRIKEVVGVRYCDIEKIPAITSQIKEMLDKHPQIDELKSRIVSFDKFNSSSLDFTVYAFAKTTDWQKYCEIKQDILLSVARIIKKNGAQFAFPTQTLFIGKDDIKG